MINVALFSHSGGLKGAERMLFNLAQSLNKKEEYKIVVFIPKTDTGIDEFSILCDKNNIEYQFINEYPYYIFNNIENLKDINSLTQKSILNIESILKNNEIDIVIVNTLVSMPAILAAKKLELPVITWVHGILDPVSARGIVMNTSFERQLYIDRMLLSLADSIVYCSDWTKRYYSSYVDSEGITINNWTLENSKLDMPVGLPKFICLNTLDKYKGVDILIKAASIVKQRGYEFELDIYGDGSNIIKEFLKDEIKRNDLNDFVKLKGRVIDTSKVYVQSTCLIQPSYLESFGLTIIEAMAHSRPVIATKSGGPESIVLDGKTGYLVEKNDMEAIAQKMIEVINNPKKNKELGINAFENYSQKYNGIESTLKFEEIITSLCNNQIYMKNTDKLIYESIIRIIDLEKNEKIYNQESQGNTVNENSVKLIDIPSDIFFSKEIKKERIYNASYKGTTLSKIGVIFASLSKIAGIGKFEIYFKNKKIREQEFILEDIKQNEWTIFYIEPIYCRKELNIQIKFSFEYKEASGYIGLFHNKKRNTLYNRCLNKLNIDTKDKELLSIYMN